MMILIEQEDHVDFGYLTMHKNKILPQQQNQINLKLSLAQQNYLFETFASIVSYRRVTLTHDCEKQEKQYFKSFVLWHYRLLNNIFLRIQ